MGFWTDKVLFLLGKSKLDRELYYVRKAIENGNLELEIMDREWEESGGICCPACMFGMQYNDLLTKQERREVPHE